jgi:Domain of unknown function (DUF4359)
MGRWQLVLLIILGIGGAISIAALTNPDRSDYEVYAIEQVGNLATSQCNRAPDGFKIVLQEPCRAAIAALKPQIQMILAANTTRQNYILFSIYRSKLSIPSVKLNTQVESIGIFKNFYTYKTP